MCCVEVADPGQQQRRWPLDAGGEGAVPASMSPSAASLAPMLSRRRQAEEMTAMVSALATVVAGGGGGVSLPAKRPAEREPEGAAVEEAWWAYCSELGAAAPSSTAAPFPAEEVVCKSL
uniref:Uncharacterized protein n=1 Tax=Oryza brachyantha TaxID=4533 RepID=J3NBQ0_ORYBR